MAVVQRAALVRRRGRLRLEVVQERIEVLVLLLWGDMGGVEGRGEGEDGRVMLYGARKRRKGRGAYGGHVALKPRIRPVRREYCTAEPEQRVPIGSLNHKTRQGGRAHASMRDGGRKRR